MDIIGFFDSVGRDLRRALRTLWRQPVFTLTAILTLALGVGATTAIFSVVYSVLIKPLPYPNAEQLVSIRHREGGANPGASSTTVAASMYFTYRDENRTFADMGLWWEAGLTLTGLRDAERVRALMVTYGTLRALGVQPMRGRWFTERDDDPRAAGPFPVILSYAFWQRQFGGKESALGSRFSTDMGPSQVVGIMPPGFRFLDQALQPDIIVALRLDPARQVLDRFNYHALARLKPGVTPAEARADVERMLPIWLRSWPATSLTREAVANLRVTPIVRPLKEYVVGGVAGMLWVLMGAIGAVLVIACANVANLMLVRADARRQTFAVRAALGARPTRIARESFVESLCIGAVGGVLGLVLAYVGLDVLVAIGPKDLPRLDEISVYPPVLAFTVAAALASTLLFGSIAALTQALHIDAPMLGATRGSTASRARSTIRGALVIVQVALALVLIVSSALMIRTFQSLRNVDPGFSDPATIQTVGVSIPTRLEPDPEQYTSMEHEILDRIAALPGVTSAGFASYLPMEGQRHRASIVVEGHPSPAGHAPPLRSFVSVSPGYFQAMGTRIIAGRSITWSDIQEGGRVALISQNFAGELAAKPADALGKRIRLSAGGAWRKVIGVVQNVHEGGLSEAPSSMVYWPVLMKDFRFLGRATFGTAAPAFVIRSKRAGTASLIDDVRRAVRSVSANIPVSQERTMQALYSDSLARTSFALVLIAIAGGMALLLGIVWIYGVVAYVVSQRTREIGIRSALGAEPRKLARMFLVHGLALSAIGAAVGLAAAVAVGRLMSSLLFGIGPTDPIAYAAALALIIAAAALASYVPARRAATIDPMQTLKAE